MHTHNHNRGIGTGGGGGGGGVGGVYGVLVIYHMCIVALCVSYQNSHGDAWCEPWCQGGADVRHGAADQAL